MRDGENRRGEVFVFSPRVQNYTALGTPRCRLPLTSDHLGFSHPDRIFREVSSRRVSGAGMREAAFREIASECEAEFREARFYEALFYEATASCSMLVSLRWVFWWASVHVSFTVKWSTW